VIGVPGVADVWPSVLLIARSACGVSVSLSVALLLPATGSVVPPGTLAEAVLLSVPVAADEMVPVTV
jgi:hypothetical protein